MGDEAAGRLAGTLERDARAEDEATGCGVSYGIETGFSTTPDLWENRQFFLLHCNLFGQGREWKRPRGENIDGHRRRRRRRPARPARPQGFTSTVARDANRAGPPFGVSAEALTAQSCLRRSPHLFAGRALRVRGEEKTCESSRRQTSLTFLIDHLPGH